MPRTNRFGGRYGVRIASNKGVTSVINALHTVKKEALAVNRGATRAARR